MTTIKLSTAKAHLGRYAREAAERKEFLISDHNRPIAKLTAVTEINPRQGITPQLGLMEGQMRIPDDFDAPLEDFEADFYGA